MAILKTVNLDKKITEIKIIPAGKIVLTISERVYDEDDVTITETFKAQELTPEQFVNCATHIPDGVKTLYQEIADISYSYIN